MKIVSVMNYKGGVGKTSVTASLGGSLAKQGYRVLLIDMDPQASLTFSFIKPEKWKKEFQKTRTLKVWFDSIFDGSPIQLSSLIFRPQKINNVIKKIGNEGYVDLIASDLGLINVDLDLATELTGGTPAKQRKSYLKVHRYIKGALQHINHDSYDIALIDCPPNFNIVTKNAIVASEHILIPAKPDYLSTLGIDYLNRSVNELIEEYNTFADGEGNISPNVLGVVFTMIGVTSGDAIAPLRPFINNTIKLGIPVFEQKLRENKSIYADAPQYGIPVSLLKASNPTQKTVIGELDIFCSQFIDRVGL